jgi:RNA polymerase sigma-70 factor (ECF subfamily)
VVEAVRQGDTASFEVLIRKYQPWGLATARRYARREEEVEDIVQEIFIKAYQKLGTFRGDARSNTGSCGSRSGPATTCAPPPEPRATLCRPERCRGRLAGTVHGRTRPRAGGRGGARRWLTGSSRCSPQSPAHHHPARDRGAEREGNRNLTGWSVPLVKVRAFRARAEMRKCLQRLRTEKYV